MILSTQPTTIVPSSDAPKTLTACPKDSIRLAMKLVKMKEANQFALARLNFSAIKTIRDACELFGKQGSAQAAKIAAELEKQLGEIEV